MSDTRLCYALTGPERSEVEVIVHRLDTDSGEEYDTESDRESGLDNIRPPEDEENDDECYHEPETSRLCIASFFCSCFEIFCGFLESCHMRKIRK